jgi:hypothetical protein
VSWVIVVTALAGALAGALATWISVLTYNRARPKIVVTVMCHPFRFPSPLASILTAGASALFERQSVNYPTHEALPTSLHQLLDRFAFAKSQGIERDSAITAFWAISIENRGHEVAEDARLLLPGAQFAQIEERRDGIPLSPGGDGLPLPEIRPDHTLRVYIWGIRLGPYDSPRLLLRKGRATVLKYEMLPPIWAKLESVRSSGALWPLIIGGLLFILSIFLAARNLTL